MSNVVQDVAMKSLEESRLCPSSNLACCEDASRATNTTTNIPAIRPTAITAQLLDERNVVVTFSLKKKDAEHLMKQVLFVPKKSSSSSLRKPPSAHLERASRPIVCRFVIFAFFFFLGYVTRLRTFLSPFWWSLDDTLTF